MGRLVFVSVVRLLSGTLGRYVGIMVGWSVVRMVGVSLVGPLTGRSIVWSGCCLLVGLVCL
jgi:hypothetical protein